MDPIRYNEQLDQLGLHITYQLITCTASLLTLVMVGKISTVGHFIHIGGLLLSMISAPLSLAPLYQSRRDPWSVTADKWSRIAFRAIWAANVFIICELYFVCMYIACVFSALRGRCEMALCPFDVAADGSLSVNINAMAIALHIISMMPASYVVYKVLHIVYSFHKKT